MNQYETVIGLEVHVELATRTKIFCGCTTEFGGEPNTHCCPVCTGMPGTLPRLNRKVVEFAMAAGLALGCTITGKCKFDRKNYFYPDLPKAYQISQLYLPLCRDGGIEIEAAAPGETAADSRKIGEVSGASRKWIGIHEIHMEEDAGKLLHDPVSGATLVDYNRCGIPLIEIVSEPDMRSAEEAIAYLEKLKMILKYLGVSDCRMQEGSLRADVNLSVRKIGTTELGTRTEMKNLNSFKAIARAVEAETRRQIELLEAGGQVLQETRRWDDGKGVSFAMRSKEDAQDYRYFPEPDLMPVEISDEWVAQIRECQPEMREEKIARYVEEYGIPPYDAQVLTENRLTAELFEKTVSLCGKPKEASNWLMVEAMRLQKEDDFTFSPENLAKLIQMVEKGRINRTVAKEVFEHIFRENVDPERYVEEHGLQVVQDTEALREAADRVVAANPQSVADYHGGKTRAMGFLVGQMMKEMRGKADPAMVNQILLEILGK